MARLVPVRLLQPVRLLGQVLGVALGEADGGSALRGGLGQSALRLLALKQLLLCKTMEQSKDGTKQEQTGKS